MKKQNSFAMAKHVAKPLAKQTITSSIFGTDTNIISIYSNNIY